MQDWLLPLLRCPATQQALTEKEGKLHSATQSYPFLHGIPCLYKNPGMALLEWGTKIQNYVNEESQQIEHLNMLARAPALELTKKRLQQQMQARQQNLDFLTSSLHAFLHYPPVPIMPSSQQIHSYFQLFFRDWCWASEELDAYTAFVSRHLGDRKLNVLVLGSGAGGLSYRLAQAHTNANIISLEHNPFLAITAERLMHGETLSMQHYESYPRSAEQAVQSWQLNADKPVGNNHQSLLAGFPHLPFVERSIDVVIAPWFFDILEQPFANAVRHALPILKDDGELLLFGPANVHKAAPEEQWTTEEMLAYLQPLFADVQHESQRLFYLDSPLAAQRRQEQIVFVHGKSPNTETRRKADDTPVKLKVTPELQQYKAQNETMHAVLGVINEDIDVPTLAKRLQEQFGFDAKEAPYYAELFIRKIQFELYSQSPR